MVKKQCLNIDDGCYTGSDQENNPAKFFIRQRHTAKGGKISV